MADSKENNDDVCKLGIEEQGGECSDPTLHEEPQENICRAMLYRSIELKKDIQQLNFRLYLLHGKIHEIEEQVMKIRDIETCSQVQEKSSFGIPVPFQNSTPDNDNLTLKIPICGKGYKVSVICNGTKCLCNSGCKDTFISLEEIQNESRRCLEEIHVMRLHKPALPVCFSFSLLCKKRCQLRTPTNFYIFITAVDKNGNDIPNHTHEIKYPACFYAEAADGENVGSETAISVSSNERKIIEENFEEIKDRLQDEKVETVLRWLVHHEVLEDSFLKAISSSMDKKGELLHALLKLDNIMPHFIEALKAAGNKELVDFLHECMESTIKITVESTVLYGRKQ